MGQEEGNWIIKRINEALKDNPVPEAVSLVVSSKLKDDLCENALRPAELTELAKTLLDNLQELPPGEVSNED